MQTKECIICHSTFTKPKNVSQKHWDNMTKTCSRSCARKTRVYQPLTQEQKDWLSFVKKGVSNPHKGHPISEETKGKIRLKLRKPYWTFNAHRTEYQKQKKLFCEECSFIALHPCQLDVDHIDGNNRNNDIKNLQTLCANCHRLKTLKNQDGWFKKYRT